MWKISKSTLVIIVVIAVMVFFEAFSIITQVLELSQKDVGEFISYTNKDYGIKLEYPENWKLEVEKNTIRLYPPWEEYIDTLPERFVIFIKNYSYVRDLDAHALEYRKILEGAWDNVKLYDSATILEQYRTFVDNDPAIKFVYTATYTADGEQYNLKVVEVFVIRGKRVYSFMYLAEADEYSDFLWVVESMIDKIDFIEE